MTTAQDLHWWRKAVFYQIYPRSFADGNGDGIGDIQGMIEHLDYLKDLGIDGVWLSPHYPSPQFDCGYDIADYTGVAPEYGSVDDLKRFLDGCHERGIRVVFDLVLNHTSDQHPWFIESRSSLSNSKRDYYVWRDGRNDGPPNNWDSIFGGSAWQLDQRTGQYYYHAFFKEQPDLNWRNPEVVNAMFEAVRFWLRLGVDGYRLDAIDTIYEDPDLTDHQPGLGMIDIGRFLLGAESEEKKAELDRIFKTKAHPQYRQPDVHTLMKQLRSVLDEFPDRVLIGETEEVAYHGNGDDELHMVFNFPLMGAKRITPPFVRTNQAKRLAALPPGAWPGNTLCNHDQPRVYSRYADGQHDAALARLHVSLLLTLRGTPFLYNGEEIGMTDFAPATVEEFRDLVGVWAYHYAIETLHMSPADAYAAAVAVARDKNRTPLQWANEPNGGFSPAGVKTWLPVNPSYARGVNVADELADPGSLLSFYRRLLRTRRATPALLAGDYQPVHEQAEEYLAFLRHASEDGQTALVVLSFAASSLTIDFGGLGARRIRPVFSSEERSAETDGPGRLALAPFEVYVGLLE